MQPTVAVQRAYEEIQAAGVLVDDFFVSQGIIRCHQALEVAQRSPASADLRRLRTLVRDEALGPTSRLTVRNAIALEEQTLAWIKVQELISQNLRALAGIANESLVAAEQ